MTDLQSMLKNAIRVATETTNAELDRLDERPEIKDSSKLIRDNFLFLSTITSLLVSSLEEENPDE